MLLQAMRSRKRPAKARNRRLCISARFGPIARPGARVVASRGPGSQNSAVNRASGHPGALLAADNCGINCHAMTQNDVKGQIRGRLEALAARDRHRCAITQ